MYSMSSVIDPYEDILTTMVELKSEGDNKCSSKATSHTRAMESFDFIICLVIGLPCDMAFDSYTSAVLIFLEFNIAAINYAVVDFNMPQSLLFKSNNSRTLDVFY